MNISLLTETIIDLSLQHWERQALVVYLTGLRHNCRQMASVLRRTGVTVKYLHDIVPSHSQDIVVEVIRKHLARRSVQRVACAIRDFQLASTVNSPNNTIGQIAKFAVDGRVKKLIVADDCQLFGKLDLVTRGVNLTPIQMDHRDDDILDDIAQEVVSNGGEVTVIKQKMIPGNRPIMAIIEAEKVAAVSQAVSHLMPQRAV